MNKRIVTGIVGATVAAPIIFNTVWASLAILGVALAIYLGITLWKELKS